MLPNGLAIRPGNYANPPTYLERGRLNSCYLCPHPSRSQASGTISFRQANSSHGSSSIKRGARDWNQHTCAVPSLHAALRKGALNRLTSQGVTSLALLTRTDGPSHPSLPFGHKNHDVGGGYTPAISAPQPCSGWERECATSLPWKKKIFNLLQIRGLNPASFDGFEYAIFILEVLLSAILAVYAFITLAYAVRYYKKLWHSPDYRIRGKSPRYHHNPRYIGYHVV